MLGEHPADRLDPEPVPVVVDEGDYLGSRGSSSAAKKADAAFKISLARRSSTFSFSQLLQLGPLVGGEPGPRTGVGLGPADPRPKVSWLTDSFAEIDSMAFHCDGYSPWCSNTIRTARSRNSGGYGGPRSPLLL